MRTEWGCARAGKDSTTCGSGQTSHGPIQSEIKCLGALRRGYGQRLGHVVCLERVHAAFPPLTPLTVVDTTEPRQDLFRCMVVQSGHQSANVLVANLHVVSLRWRAAFNALGKMLFVNQSPHT